MKTGKLCASGPTCAAPGPLLCRRSRCSTPPPSLRTHSVFSPALPRPCRALQAISPKDVAVNGDSPPTGIPIEKCRVAIFSAQSYMMPYFESTVIDTCPESKFIKARLDEDTAALAKGYDVVCIFVNDVCGRQVLEVLAAGGVKLVALRCAGYDGVDVEAANELGIKVVRVANYSPTSVAEYAVALTMSLVRNIHRAYNRVWQGNYTLSGLEGMEIHKKTVGVIGTGPIGECFCSIMKGFGCKVLAHALEPNPKCVEMGVEYVSLNDLLEQADIVSLHCPLDASTFHIINRERLVRMKSSAILINVSRGGLVDTDALLDALEAGHLGGCGMDVYENEGSLFFEDFTVHTSQNRLKSWDRRFASLKVYPNVLITPHSAFLTNEALQSIANMTVENIKQFCEGENLTNEVNPFGQ